MLSAVVHICVSVQMRYTPVYPGWSRPVTPPTSSLKYGSCCGGPPRLARLGCITMAPDSSLTRMKIMLVYIYNFTPALLRPPPSPLLEFCNSTTTMYIDSHNNYCL